MHKLKRKLSLVRKKDLSTDEVESEDDWQEDEMKVRKGTCNFLLHVTLLFVVFFISY